MIKITDSVSKDLIAQMDLVPIPPGQTRVFRLIRANKKDENSSRGVSSPAAHLLADRDMIYDPFKQQNVMIFNVTGNKTVALENGAGFRNVPITSPAVFGNDGTIRCDHKNNELYFYLKLHNKNQSNPNRDPYKAPVFYEVDEQKEIKDKDNILDYKALALILSMRMSEGEATQVAVNLMRIFGDVYKFDFSQANDIKIGVKQIADSTPVHFLRALKEPKSYARLIIDDLVTRKVIAFNDHKDSRTWVWKGLAEKDKKKTILKVGEEDPREAFIDFLISDKGTIVFADMKEDFEKYYKEIQ